MARVNIEDIIDHLSYEMRNALKDSVGRVIQDTEFDDNQLFREFRSAVGRKCNMWEYVPDHLVKKDN